MIEEWVETGILNTLVANLGRVKRVDGFVYSLQVCSSSNGYNYVHLYENNKTKAYKVSRLVAKAFIPNPDNTKYVDHINTIRTDDRLENLQWTTWHENNNNPLTLQKRRISRLNPRPYSEKPIIQFSKQGEFIREWSSATAFGKSIGKIVNGNIIANIKGKQPSAYGYKWKYKNK